MLYDFQTTVDFFDRYADDSITVKIFRNEKHRSDIKIEARK